MKHTLFIAALAALLSTQAHGQSTPEPSAFCHTLEITGLKTGAGPLMLAAYASAESFFKKPAWVNSTPVDGATMRVALCNWDAAEVAIAAFQDSNGNGRLDSNPMGIPTEPTASSGHTPLFRAPSWGDAKVPLNGNAQTISIKF